jgi:hypothetical protein
MWSSGQSSWLQNGDVLLFPNVSEAGICLRLRVEPILLGRIDRASLKSGQWIMSRIVIVILIYHRYKPIDSINLLGS